MHTYSNWCSIFYEIRLINIAFKLISFLFKYLQQKFSSKYIAIVLCTRDIIFVKNNTTNVDGMEKRNEFEIGYGYFIKRA